MAEQYEMTQKGYDEAKKKLEYLMGDKRREIVERIAEARSHGDLSENAEYDAARNEQAANELEITELDYKLKNAVILKENNDTTFVHIGSKVKVYDEDMDEEDIYEITGSMEANANENKISNESPVGKALLGHKVGDGVKVVAPNGEYTLKIMEIH
jgi:transcription elongation factor GreA